MSSWFHNDVVTAGLEGRGYNREQGNLSSSLFKAHLHAFLQEKYLQGFQLSLL